MQFFVIRSLQMFTMPRAPRYMKSVAVAGINRPWSILMGTRHNVNHQPESAAILRSLETTGGTVELLVPVSFAYPGVITSRMQIYR